MAINDVRSVNEKFRSEIISNHPLFTKIPSENINEFVRLMQEVYYYAGQQIVMEGDFVDSFFFHG